MAWGSTADIMDCDHCLVTDRAPCVTNTGRVAKVPHKCRQRAAALHDDGRAVYAEQTRLRNRMRNVMYALDFERVGASAGKWEVGKVLGTYDETFVGELGSVTIHWNQ